MISVARWKVYLVVLLTALGGVLAGLTVVANHYAKRDCGAHRVGMSMLAVTSPSKDGYPARMSYMGRHHVA